MSTETIKFKVEAREAAGKGEVGRMRRDGNVPGVVYGQGSDASKIQFNAHEFEIMMKHHGSENLLMDLEVGSGAPTRVLLKEVQHHPLTSKVLHVDFQEISMDQKLTLEVPLECVGSSVGVGLGGTLEMHIRTVELECLPADVVERIDVDVSALEIGDGVHVSDLDLDLSKYTVHTASDIMIASVAAPRVASEEGEADADATSAEPELIGGSEEEDAGEEG